MPARNAATSRRRCSGRRRRGLHRLSRLRAQRVIASEAKQSRLGCAQNIRVWITSSLSLLAMTMGRDNGQANRRRRHRIRPMPVRQGRLRDRRARALGLARPFRIEPPRAWRGLRHLCRQLAQTLPHRQRQDSDHALRGQGDRHRAQLLCDLRHAIVLRTRPLAAHGQHPARVVLRPHRTAAALSHRDRRTAGMGLYRRAAGAVERLSRRGLAALQEEAPRGGRGPVRAQPRRRERSHVPRMLRNMQCCAADPGPSIRDGSRVCGAAFHAAPRPGHESFTSARAAPRTPLRVSAMHRPASSA